MEHGLTVNLFTRPRRFGKTLNMSMLQYFFENSKKDNSYLFEGLNIIKEGYKNIIRYGISFYEKDCYVKLGED